MLVSDFDYELPREQIAQAPLADRDGSRLLQLRRDSGSWEDRSFRKFPELLRPSDLLVLNNTRVFPARLYGQRSRERAQPRKASDPTEREFLSGRVEVLLTRQLTEDPNEWDCLVRPGRKIRVGEKLFFRAASGVAPGPSSDVAGDAQTCELEAEVTGLGPFGERRLRFAPVADFFACVERIGHVPLPLYIHRFSKDDDDRADRERYQTVYAQARGSVAAPTAGLHFTPQILERIRERGVEIAEITLHVGLGTFQPVRVERVEEHKLHRERYEISPPAARSINLAKAEKRRVVAVGTTTVRALEYAAELAAQGSGDLVEAGRGHAATFIYPGYRFRVVDALLTNFHLPQSTLLMLVCAFGGTELVMRAYRHAVAAGYRFYSYGDCMMLE